MVETASSSRRSILDSAFRMGDTKSTETTQVDSGYSVTPFRGSGWYA
jgi:hypothetical protein